MPCPVQVYLRPGSGGEGRRIRVVVASSEESARTSLEALERANRLLLALNRVAVRIAGVPSLTATFDTLGKELQALGVNSLVALKSGEGTGFVIEHSSIDSKALDAVRTLTGLSFQGYRLHPERWPHDVSGPVFAGEALFVTDAMPVAAREVPLLPPKVTEAALRLVGWSTGTPSIHAPLVAEEQVIGLLAVWGADLQRADVAVFTAFAGQLATAIANIRLHEALRQQTVELSRVQLQLLQSFRLASIGELAAFVAHEVNNPLTSVVGNLWEVLSDLPFDAPERERLEVALQEAARIGQVVKTLLAHTQRPSPTAEQTSLNDVVEGALLLFQQRLARMQLEIDLAPALPPIMGDANELRHVVVNLLSNALDATPDGGRVSVATRAVDRRDQRFVEVTITDSGEGMPAGELAHIFEPFFTTKGMDNRPGLGLAVSKRIIEQHGGSIEAESMPSRGSRFTVLLPAI